MENRNRQLASKTLLIAALVLFVAFHLLPCFDPKTRGWEVWPSLFSDLQDLESLIHRRQDAVVMASFLNFSLLITISPFLTKVLKKSRLAWWFVTVCSGLAVAGFWGMFFASNPASSPNSGGWCLMFAPLLNFYGLILANSKAPLDQRNTES